MGTLTKRLQQNTFFAAISLFVRLSTNALIFILIARTYGPEQFGQFTTAFTLATIFVLFADFGFDLLLTTEIAQDRSRVPFLFPRMFGIKLLLSLIAVVLMCSYVLLQNMSAKTSGLSLVFSFYLFFSALLSFFFAFFRAQDELHHESVITFVTSALLLASVLLMGALRWDLYAIAATFVGTRIAGVLLAIRRSRKITSWLRPRLDLGWYRKEWKKMAVFGLYFIFGNLFFLVDTLLISMLRGDHDVGLYQSVFRIVLLILMFPEILISAFLPSLMRISTVDKNQWIQLGAITSKSLQYAGLLAGLVLAATSSEVIEVLYGIEQYGEAVSVLRILGVVVMIRYSFAIPAVLLTTSHRQQTLTFIVIIATALNILLNLYAIPQNGIQGAAIVSAITNAFVLFAISFSLRDDFKSERFVREKGIPLFLSASGIAVAFLAPEFPFYYYLIPIIGILIIYVLHQCYSKWERDVLWQAVRGVVSL